MILVTRDLPLMAKSLSFTLNDTGMYVFVYIILYFTRQDSVMINIANS